MNFVIRKSQIENKRMFSDDEKHMKLALDLARKGEGYTSPNPMVGAVIVKDRVVVGQGFHEAVGKAHAEVNAIDQAGYSTEGATLYVTLEPCNHFGRTPPCTEKILQAGIRRVVVAQADPNQDVRGGGMDYLKSKGVNVEIGLCEHEARKLNDGFIKYVQTKRPFVMVKCAATLDGQIATRTGDSKWVTNEDSRYFVHRLRHAADAVMVGIGTVQKDDPSLTTRLKETPGVDPKRIILDTHLSISEDAKVLRLESESDTIIVTGKHIPEDKKDRIQAKGIYVLESSLREGRIDLNPLMDRLGAMGITSLLIEGGGYVIASALASDIVDKVFFFYAPKILGGNDGIPICKGQGPALMNQSLPVHDIEVTRFGDDVLIQGYIRKRSDVYRNY